jgi:hypothetical protein
VIDNHRSRRLTKYRALMLIGDRRRFAGVALVRVTEHGVAGLAATSTTSR